MNSNIPLFLETLKEQNEKVGDLHTSVQQLGFNSVIAVGRTLPMDNVLGIINSRSYDPKFISERERITRAVIQEVSKSVLYPVNPFPRIDYYKKILELSRNRGVEIPVILAFRPPTLVQILALDSHTPGLNPLYAGFDGLGNKIQPLLDKSHIKFTVDDTNIKPNYSFSVLEMNAFMQVFAATIKGEMPFDKDKLYNNISQTLQGNASGHAGDTYNSLNTKFHESTNIQPGLISAILVSQ